MSNETYNELEGAVLTALENVQNASGTESYGKKVADAVQLIDRLLEADKNFDESVDKAERREIDRDRNEANAQIEIEKSSLSWKKVTFELVKVFGPVLASVVSFGVFQNRMLRFEETGRFTSSVSREMHLPNLLNFKK